MENSKLSSQLFLLLLKSVKLVWAALSASAFAVSVHFDGSIKQCTDSFVSVPFTLKSPVELLMLYVCTYFSVIFGSYWDSDKEKQLTSRTGR